MNTIKSFDPMYEWFINEWINLIAVNPETHQFSVFKEGNFIPYEPIKQVVETVKDMEPILESTLENIPVYLIK